jgi:hypothetical protein
LSRRCLLCFGRGFSRVPLCHHRFSCRWLIFRGAVIWVGESGSPTGKFEGCSPFVCAARVVFCQSRQWPYTRRDLCPWHASPSPLSISASGKQRVPTAGRLASHRRNQFALNFWKLLQNAKYPPPCA